MSVSLVLGASGQIGVFLVPRLLAEGDTVLAVSRRARAEAEPNLHWLAGDLYRDMPELPALDAIYSLGPLDGFADWLERAQFAGTPRLLAFGSMSVEAKRTSADPAERALSDRLADAERRAFTVAARRGLAYTIFRPTLIYGAGLDRSLAPLARFALNWRVLPVPFGACGLRQPVHAADLAAACLAARDRGATCGRTYALGGGERLRFDAMLARLHAALPRRALKLPVPLALLGPGLSLARRFGWSVATDAALTRLTEDLIADCTLAQKDFGYAPRAFVATDVLGSARQAPQQSREP